MEELVLQIWPEGDGCYGGRILRDGKEDGRISGCYSVAEVEEQAVEIGISVTRKERLLGEPRPY